MKCAKLMLRRNNLLTTGRSLRRKIPSELSLIGDNTLSDTRYRRAALLPYETIRCSSSSVRENESQTDKREEGSDKWRFTWRHEIEPLPRIQMENTRIHSDWRVGLTLDAYASFTAYLMQVPLWTLATRTWRQDLADHTGWAFVRSIACLLSNVYKVPLEDVINKGDAESESLSIEFQYTTPDTMADVTMKNNSESNSEEVNITGNEASTAASSKSSNERPQVDFCEEVRDMLQEKLYYLFKNNHAHCHVGKGNGRHLELTLHMKPVRATLRSLQCFPGLSRPAVEEKPARWEEYISMMRLARAEGLQSFLPKLMEFNDEMLAQRGKWETTAIAEVTVECIETFSVRDIHSNATIQGLSPLSSSNSTGGRPQNVLHLVRLEKNFTLLEDRDGSNGYYYQEPGNWCITDIDDLLDGNKWHRNM